MTGKEVANGSISDGGNGSIDSPSSFHAGAASEVRREMSPLRWRRTAVPSPRMISLFTPPPPPLREVVEVSMMVPAKIAAVVVGGNSAIDKLILFNKVGGKGTGTAVAAAVTVADFAIVTLKKSYKLT